MFFVVTGKSLHSSNLRDFGAAPWDIIMWLVLPPISVHSHTNALYIAGCMTFGSNLGAAESIVTDTGSAGAACMAVFKRRKSPTHQASDIS